VLKVARLTLPRLIVCRISRKIVSVQKCHCIRTVYIIMAIHRKNDFAGYKSENNVVRAKIIMK